MTETLHTYENNGETHTVTSFGDGLVVDIVVKRVPCHSGPKYTAVARIVPDHYASPSLALEGTKNALAALVATVREPIVTIDPSLTANVLSDVICERQRQGAKWNQQHHDMPVWMTVIGEEFGEVCQAILKARPNPNWESDGSRDALRAELVQLAAVTIAAIEAMDDERSVPGMGVPA